MVSNLEHSMSFDARFNGLTMFSEPLPPFFNLTVEFTKTSTRMEGKVDTEGRTSLSNVPDTAGNVFVIPNRTPRTHCTMSYF